MKKLLITLLITTILISCQKEEIISPANKEGDRLATEQPQPFVKIKTQVSPINSGTSFYNTLDKDYQNIQTKIRPLISTGEHISWARGFVDFDKDGDDDYIVSTTNYNQSRFFVYIIKNTNNNFTLWKKLDGFIWPMVGGLGDFDNNGYLDFWVSDQGYENPQQNYYPGAPIGIVYFYKDSANVKYIPNSTDFNHTASSGDIDNDGDVDLITVDYKYINDGKGNFDKQNAIKEKVNAGYFHNEIYDLDNDGKLDMIIGHAEIFGDSIWDSNPRKYNGRNRIYWGNSNEFSYTNSTQLPMTHPNTKDTFAIVDDYLFYDFNSDGWQDIIILRSCWRGAGYYIQFLQNNKNRTFTEVSEQYIDNYKYNIPNGSPNSFVWLVRLRLVDLNGDNKLDIIAREGATPGFVPDREKELYWYNDGNNRFKLK